MVLPLRPLDAALRRRAGGVTRPSLVRSTAWALPLLALVSGVALLGACAKDDSSTAYGGGGYNDLDATMGDDTSASDAPDGAKPDVKTDGPTEGGGGGDGGVCTPKTCAQLGAECGNAPDGCGGKISCGTCQSGKQCGGGGANKCGVNACAPKTCVQVSATCGYASDMCADVIDCGKCSPPGSCGGAGVQNQCGCTPKTCAQLGASCGSVPDGCGGKVDCGKCGAADTCGGNGVPNQCGPGTCAAKTCAQLQAACGYVSDGCGTALDCGKCADPNTCGGGGVAHQCGCQAKTCIQLGASCGPMPNGCGQTIDCGTCPSGEVCGGSGVPHQCGCACNIPHAVASCDKGVCKMVKCEVGWADCDGDQANGCEVNSDTDVNNCGLCGSKCTFTNATASCAAGKCAMGACTGGFSDCNASTVDGCEQAEDVQHCGSCTNDCSAVVPPNVTTPACTGGQCSVGQCAPNTVDQNKTYLDGCECTADTVANDCAGGTTVAPDPFPLGGNVTLNGTLVPNGLNDWYVVHFGGANSCSYHPKVVLADTSGTGLLRLDVSADCAASAIACSEGGNPVGLSEWEFTVAGPCGQFSNPDLTRFPAQPSSITVRVYATGPSTTCLPYTLTITN